LITAHCAGHFPDKSSRASIGGRCSAASTEVWNGLPEVIRSWFFDIFDAVQDVAEDGTVHTIGRQRFQQLTVLIEKYVTHCYFCSRSQIA